MSDSNAKLFFSLKNRDSFSINQNIHPDRQCCKIIRSYKWICFF